MLHAKPRIGVSDGYRPRTCLRHVSPLGWEHIVLTGDYDWELRGRRADQRPSVEPLSREDPRLAGTLRSDSLRHRRPLGRRGCQRDSGDRLESQKDETENIHRILPQGDLDRRRQYPSDDSW